MTTWKTLVTIMSVMSLTLVNVNSTYTGGSSSSSSEQFYNVPFKTYTSAYRCYHGISQFCQVQFSADDEVTSLECAKQGMLKYHKDIPNLHDTVYFYFERFPLNSEAIDLPKKFCENKADRCMNDLSEYNAIVAANPPTDDSEAAVQSAERKSRKEIAIFAFLNKGVAILSLWSRQSGKDYAIEKEYIQHLSDNIGTLEPTYNPLNFCGRPNIRRYLRTYRSDH